MIDPVSTWYKSGYDLTAQNVADRLIDWSKREGINLICTSLLDEMSNRQDNSLPQQISALVDIWIHLSYLVQAGERNRGLSIIKARGSSHSNQVRELVLSGKGVTLTDTYTAGGEVLMGTQRWQKELAEKSTTRVAEVAAKLSQVKLDAQEAELEVSMRSLQTELEAKRLEKALLIQTRQSHQDELLRSKERIKEMRGDDDTIADEKASKL